MVGQPLRSCMSKNRHPQRDIPLRPDTSHLRNLKKVGYQSRKKFFRSFMDRPTLPLFKTD